MKFMTPNRAGICLQKAILETLKRVITGNVIDAFSLNRVDALQVVGSQTHTGSFKGDEGV
jgi:hypothetical protein